TARAARVVTTPSAKMTSTLVFTSATASSGRRATFPSPHCGSSTKLRPCTQPWSTSPRNTASSSRSDGGAARRKPTRRIRSACCARAASGHDTIAPPRSVMNSRRFIRSHCIHCPPNQRGSIADWRGSSQGRAAVRDFGRAKRRLGSFSTDGTARDARGMSAMPSKSDQIDASRQKHLTHRSKQSSLFDHLVGDAALDFKKELKVPYWVFSETSEGKNGRLPL